MSSREGANIAIRQRRREGPHGSCQGRAERDVFWERQVHLDGGTMAAHLAVCGRAPARGGVRLTNLKPVGGSGEHEEERRNIRNSPVVSAVICK